jgi:hypothetical protein
MPGEKLVEPRGGMIGDPAEHVGEPSLRVDVGELGRGNQGVYPRGVLAAAVGAGEQSSATPQRNTAQRAFGSVVAEADVAIVEKAGKGRPTGQHVVDRPSGLGMARQPGARGAHPFFEVGDHRLAVALSRRQAIRGQQTVDPTLDGKDRVDVLNRRGRQRRFAQIGQLEEVAPAMAPAGRLGDRAGFAFAVVELAEPGISIGLQDAGIASEMPGGMLAAAIVRVEEHRRRRAGPANGRSSRT